MYAVEVYATVREIADVPVHGRETPICAYAAMGSWPI